MSIQSISQDAIEEVLAPLDQWAHQCHAASVELVRSGVIGTCRVARGSAQGVGSQHSWLVLGMDCYNDDALIIDPTLWSYVDEVEGVFIATYRDSPYKHRPHGKGMIWDWGRPETAAERGEWAMPLTPSKPLSDEALAFLDLIGPLSKQGWIQLAHAPVEGWPSKEIIEAMCDTGLSGYIPIDIRGMVTDRNPSGLYLPADSLP